MGSVILKNKNGGEGRNRTYLGPFTNRQRF
jgi:hypothetical protein